MQSNGRAAAAIAALLAAVDAISVRRAWAPEGDRVLLWLAIACTLGAAVLAGWAYGAAVARWADRRPWRRAGLTGLPFALWVGAPLGRMHTLEHALGSIALPAACGATLLAAAAVCRAIATRPTRRVAALALCGALALLLADGALAQRPPPALHAGLVLLAVALLTFGVAAPRMLTTPGHLRAAALAACALAAAAWLLLGRSANVNFIARAQAPVTGLVLRALAWAPSSPTGPDRSVARTPPRAARYADANLVLVTVDAQRADAPLPALDARLPRALRFSRVYAQAPHTAWSVSSLLTGAYPDRLRGAAPPTLAERLRARHFYTDAFYPAGLFFDGRAPLERYAAARFGFEWSDTRTLDAHTLTDAVLARLAEEQRQWADQPRLFLWAHYFDPHEPYLAHDGVPAGAPARARYDGEVAFVDRELLRLVDGLRSLLRPTLVVITADHGEEFGEHGGAYHGTTVYEEQVRVPLRLFVVGGAPLTARELDGPVELVDLAPTVLDLLGIEGEAEGHSLAAQLDGAPLLARDAHAQVDTRRMLVRDGWKLIHDLRGGALELYDLARDPSERRNLAASEPARLAALEAALSAWFELPSAGVLAATLADEQAPAERRVAAARALGVGQPPIAAAALRRALAAPEAAVRSEAALALAELSDEAARVPLAALLDDARLRRRAALALGHLRDARAVPALREALASIDPSMRRHAVHYLGWLAGAQDAALLEERALADLKIRGEAYLALGRLCARTGAPGVTAFLKRRLSEEEYDDARSRLVEALALAATPEPN